MKPTSFLPLALLAVAASATAQLPANFGLRNGDTVVFYGDSITDARQYTIFTEAYVLTRFPQANIRFVHSGWGGDRVTGGGGGPIDLRLNRDVFPYRPSVVTIMLGMNDGGYRPFDQGLSDTFENGYNHIVDRLTTELPGVRLTLIKPSPYDDVTRAVGFPGGYNAVLQKYSDTIAKIAARKGATVADLNAPMITMLTNAVAKDPVNAQKLLPDRVHPGGAGHLVMAGALLNSWNAPALVSGTTIDATNGKATIDAGRISQVKVADGKVEWRSTEAALPFPLDIKDPLTALSVGSSDFVQKLDLQLVMVKGLDASKSYALSIDGGAPVVTLTGAEWANGANLALLETPMQLQARDVMSLIRAHSDVHNIKWRSIQTPLAGRKEAIKEREKAFRGLDEYDRALSEAARKAAKPKEHRFVLTAA